jgi:SAM-dependent methyltransferase
MSLFYKFQYLVGMTPWERMPSLPIGQQAVVLLDREERGREPPYGRALDLGCGTGFWSVRLAQRGWTVTGIDIVSKAVRAARARARKAGVEPLFVEGSVAALAAAGVGSGFRLILDFGVVHGLPPEQVRAVSREVTAGSRPRWTLSRCKPPSCFASASFRPACGLSRDAGGQRRID